MKLERVLSFTIAMLATAHLMLAFLWKSSSGLHATLRIVIDLLIMAISFFWFTKTRQAKQQTLAERRKTNGR
ncbi:hypothetical protein RBB79_01510 [Tunturiibacter empetritectus]|jgi:hypothetical protein|uniref:Uncharacterized protein n=1 Tax=Tunturiibacter lichenicola TaxID=2051959 RepID=A0A852V9T7_9BACT|nr:hypothetical protein [Edaphobacter lichenicola]NYF88167.1 hypothetical protein [Edaphobacter lichenicola]